MNNFFLTFALPVALLTAFFSLLAIVGVLSRLAYQALAIILVVFGFGGGIILSIGDTKPFFRAGMVLLVTGILLMIINV